MFKMFSAAIFVPLWLAGCAPHDPRADGIAALAGDPAKGEALYREACARCHSETGAKLKYGLALYGLAGSISIVIDGVPSTKMQAYSQYSDQQIADLFAYLRSFRK
jgi:mono/diheme cytochrome c family protein